MSRNTIIFILLAVTAAFGIPILINILFSPPDEWIRFLIVVILYALFMVYLGHGAIEEKSAPKKFLPWALLAFFILVPVLLALWIFSYGVVTLPKTNVPYFFLGLVVILISIASFEFCLNIIVSKPGEDE